MSNQLIKYKTPTNEDAKSLPTVEVRPDESYNWQEAVLLAVVENPHVFA